MQRNVKMNHSEKFGLVKQSFTLTEALAALAVLGGGTHAATKLNQEDEQSYADSLAQLATAAGAGAGAGVGTNLGVRRIVIPKKMPKLPLGLGVLASLPASIMTYRAMEPEADS
jgi:hypothetical protein